MPFPKYLDQTKVLKVTAADFNGKEFDGTPFSYADGTECSGKPEWFLNAVRDKKIWIHNHGCDYAWWGFEHPKGYTFGGERTWAGPGDYIVNLGNDEKPEIYVVPGPIMELIIANA